MNDEKLKLIVRNTKTIEHQSTSDVGLEYVSLPQINQPNQIYDINALESVADRLKKLQGNLRILERQYRANLKDGFDNKIKAYRLEAVVERKLLKEAITSVKKSQENENAREKVKFTHSNTLHNSRIELMKVQRENREKVFRQKIKEEKRGISLSLYEKRLSSEQKAKEIHDKILEQSESKNKKKEYFCYLRKTSIKKEEEALKHSLLEKIMLNTQKLKQLKANLQSLKENEIKVQKTFLTI